MAIKRMMAAALAASMVFGFCSCSGGNSANSGKSGGYDKIVFAYASFNNIPSSETLKTVEAEINKITEKKINADIELKPIAIANYSKNVNLALSGGDQIDIFESLGNFNTCVATDMAADITEIIDKSAPETKELLGSDFLAACTKDNKVYGIPTYKPYALTPMVIYKKDIAEKLGIDMTKVTSLNDLTEVARKVKAANQSMTPIVPANQGNLNLNLCVPSVDFLTDDYNSPKGVLMGDSKTVVDYYSTPEFTNLCKTVRTWHDEGLILKDAATTTSTATELMSGDNSFCYIASYSYPTADTAASLEPQCGGQKLGAVQIGDAYLDTTGVNAVSWMISSNTKAPETALKFLNLTYTDKDIINLLIYGIKDRDYVINDDGYVSYPEGKDATTVPYTAQLSCGTLGNFFLMYPMVGTNKESLAWEEEQNQKAKRSPAMGFTFDSSSVKTEYTAVSNVITQYLPGLLCGSVDPTTMISEFESKLKTAGLPKIIEEKQKQLDAWIATK